jgi:signal transduction histidine kinase
MEKRYIKKDGAIIWANMAASAVRDIMGAFQYSFGMVVDITGRKGAEKELMDYTEKLDRSNKIKELFIDTLHHDLMNPLQVMIMYLDVLKDVDTLSPEDHTKYAQIMEDNVKRSIDLLEDAATYAKIESLDELTLDTLDLGALVQAAVKSVIPLMGDRTIDVKLDGTFIISGNKMLAEIFINLISNSAKYSPGGSPIEVGIKDEGDVLKVYVKDQGTGVPDEFKETIFQRLERGKRMGIHGSGLGLAIAKRIVQIHNGKIWVEDNSPAGSIFYVQLPKDRDQ